jgi:hypothetical protein
MLQPPRNRDKSFTMVIRYGLNPDVAAGHWSVGILMRGYPAPFRHRGDTRKRFANPEALAKYGEALWNTCHNIAKEVNDSKRDATIEVHWHEDGRPIVKVIQRLIFVPDGIKL